MKRLILMAAIASAALASCVKNEVIIDTPPQEIAYQTVIDPATKADLDETKQEAFPATNVFTSWAFLYAGASNTWPAGNAATNPYIDGKLVSYNSSKWATSPASYWPKDQNSTLTFFAWTDQNGSTPPAATGATISCSTTTGVKFANYDITQNKNKDVLVADVANDMTANNGATNTYGHTGIPTIFRHILSKFVFNVATSADYSASGYSFKVNSITFNDIIKEADYNQYNGASPAGWGTTSPAEFTKANIASFDNEQAFTNSTKATSDGYTILIPQAFDTKSVTIKYTITSGAENKKVEETVTVTKTLTELFAGISGVTALEQGKSYVVNITVSLTEITWDPIIEKWEDVAAGSATI